MRILMLMALLLASLGWPTAATAAESAMSAPRSDGLFQGTADASEANLTALCDSYMREVSFITMSALPQTAA